MNKPLTAATTLNPVDLGRIPHIVKAGRSFFVRFPADSSPPRFEQSKFGINAVKTQVGEEFCRGVM